MVNQIIEKASKKLLEKFKEEFTDLTDFLRLHKLLYCNKRLEAVEEEKELINEIIDGFLTENFLRFGIDENWEGNYLFVSDLEIDGKKVATHIDLFNKKEQIGIELKAPIFIYPKGQIPSEKEVYEGKEADYFAIPENYLTQAQVQAFLLKKEYPKLKYFLVLKTTTKVFSENRVRFKKVWIIKEIPPMSEEEFSKLVKRYKENKDLPKWSWECRYCSLKKKGLCKGVNTEELTDKEIEEIRELYGKYLKLKEELDNLEKQLKWKLKGKSIKIENREIGYVERESQTWNWEKIKQVLTPEELINFFQPNWRKYKDLEKTLKEKGLAVEEFKEAKITKIFKL